MIIEIDKQYLDKMPNQWSDIMKGVGDQINDRLQQLQQENVSVSSVKIEEIKESLNELTKEMANTKPPEWTNSIAERRIELMNKLIEAGVFEGGMMV
jgi:predicted transcriptional regulator YheO